MLLICCSLFVHVLFTCSSLCSLVLRWLFTICSHVVHLLLTIVHVVFSLVRMPRPAVEAQVRRVCLWLLTHKVLRRERENKHTIDIEEVWPLFGMSGMGVFVVHFVVHVCTNVVHLMYTCYSLCAEVLCTSYSHVLHWLSNGCSICYHIGFAVCSLVAHSLLTFVQVLLMCSIVAHVLGTC